MSCFITWIIITDFFQLVKKKVEFSENFVSFFRSAGKSECLTEMLALIFQTFLRNGIMKERKLNLPNISVLGEHKGVQDGIDKDTNCWF